LIGPSLKDIKLWRAPNMEGYILEYRVPALWPMYIGERRTTFAKAYGIKVRCYWELFCFEPLARPHPKEACMES